MKTKVTNKELIYHFLRSKANGKVTAELDYLMRTMIDKAINSPNYINFKNKNGMKNHALKALNRAWGKVRLHKSTNIYAYYHTCIRGAFCNYLNKIHKLNGQ